MLTVANLSSQVDEDDIEIALENSAGDFQHEWVGSSSASWLLSDDDDDDEANGKTHSEGTHASSAPSPAPSSAQSDSWLLSDPEDEPQSRSSVAARRKTARFPPFVEASDLDAGSAQRLEVNSDVEMEEVTLASHVAPVVDAELGQVSRSTLSFDERRSEKLKDSEPEKCEESASEESGKHEEGEQEGVEQEEGEQGEAVVQSVAAQQEVVQFDFAPVPLPQVWNPRVEQGWKEPPVTSRAPSPAWPDWDANEPPRAPFLHPTTGQPIRSNVDQSYTRLDPAVLAVLQEDMRDVEDVNVRCYRTCNPLRSSFFLSLVFCRTVGLYAECDP